MKNAIKSRIIDIGLLTLLLLIVLVPGIRLPVMSSLQKVLLQTGLFNASTTNNPPEEKISYQFQLQDIHGKEFNPESLRGSIVFINVWATWCPPCIAEMPEIAVLHQEVGQEVVFLMISVDKDRAKAERWIQEKNYPVPVYFAEQWDSSLSYEAIPTTWIIDRAGSIVFERSGMAQYNTDSFKAFLLSL